LEHDHPVLHWDLMLECGEVLKTWRLAEAPAQGQTVRAEAIADHRKLYLDYEGPVSGSRGKVKRWDGGFYWEDVAGCLVSNTSIGIILEGSKVRGNAILEASAGGGWFFTLR